MDNEYLIRKLVKIFQYKQNQLLKGKLLSSAIPNTLVDVQTKIGIKRALNLNITNATDDCLVTKDIDSNELVVFSLPKSNNTRNIEIINRKQKSIKKEGYTLDTAILYAIKETKSSPVNFINPTWDLGGDSTGYICIPRPEGDRGEYPDEATCMQQANEYWQELVDNLDEQYSANYAFWENAIVTRNNAIDTFPLALANYLNNTTESPQAPNDTYFPPVIVTWNSYSNGSNVTIIAWPSPRYCDNNELTSFVAAGYNQALFFNRARFIENSTIDLQAPSPPVRQDNPPVPTSTTASNKALSFYYKSSSKSDPIKLLEINELEAFEAIVVKNTTTEVPIIKIGRAKETIYEPDLGSSSSNGQYEYYWVVNDLESWYKMIFCNITNLDQNTEYYYEDFIESNLDNYQSWRYQDFYIYPFIPTDQPCKTGINYISQIDLEDKYKSVANYQSLSNFTNNKLVNIETVMSVGNTYNFNCEELSVLNTSNYNIRITDYKIKENSNVCNKTKQSSLSKNIVLPNNLVFVLFKPFVTK